MKQLAIYAFLFCGLVSNTIAQVNFEATDYPAVGDEFAIITYTNNPGEDTVLMSDFENTAMNFSSIAMFSEYTIDTIRFLNPANYDTEENFPEATHLLRNGTMDYYILKDTESARVIGFSGDQFQIGMEFPIVADNPLTLMQFPTTTETNFSDETSGERVMPVSALESVIPPDYYSTFSALFDSLKIMLTVETSHEILETQDIIINLGSANNGTYTCLKEYEESTTVVDIYVRSGFSGAWSPLSSVPGIGESLPVDLPYTDSTFTLKWWNPDFGWPLAEAETEQTRDTVFSLKFHYNGQNSIANNSLSEISVYPNPASGTVMVNTNALKNQPGTLELLNSEGKKLRSFSINGKFVTFVADDLPNSWYFIRLLDNKGNPVAYQKLVIKHE